MPVLVAIGEVQSGWAARAALALASQSARKFESALEEVSCAGAAVALSIVIPARNGPADLRLRMSLSEESHLSNSRGGIIAWMTIIHIVSGIRFILRNNSEIGR